MDWKVLQNYKVGAIKNPKYISIYAKNFETKNKIIEYLEKYNENKELGTKLSILICLKCLYKT